LDSVDVRGAGWEALEEEEGQTVEQASDGGGDAGGVRNEDDRRHRAVGNPTWRSLVATCEVDMEVGVEVRGGQRCGGRERQSPGSREDALSGRVRGGGFATL